jgi:large subunit ribosomal protein L18
MRPQEKNRRCQLRHWRLRKKVCGTAARPRMAVKFTQQHIYVQFVNDDSGVTLASVSSRVKALRERGKLAANKTGAKLIGVAAAEAAKAKGIQAVVFDRAGAKYHGKVKELADAARKGGLKF